MNICYFIEQLSIKCIIISMNEKTHNKNDLRYRFTEDLIKRAIADIISEKKTTKISVAELIQRCNINRGTFYNHYNSIEDLIKVMCNDFVCECFSKIKSEKINISTDILIDVLSYIKRNRKLFELMISDDYRLQTTDQIIDFVLLKYFGKDSKKRSISNDIETIVIFMVNGSVSIATEWAKNNYKLELEIVADKIARLNQAIISKYFF